MTKALHDDTHVLVIDDDRALADTLVDFLHGLGYSATAAYSGSQGLETFQNGGFAIVLLDHKMPDMLGTEVLEAIAALDKRTAVIMITGEGSIPLAVEAIKKGAYDFLTKPCDFKILEIILDRAGERHQFIRRMGLFRGLTLALLVSIPMWLLLGILLAMALR